MENYDHQEWRPTGKGFQEFRENEVTQHDIDMTGELILSQFGGIIANLISDALIRAVLEHDRARMTERTESRFAEFYMQTREMKDKLTEESKRIWRDRGQEPPV